MTFQRPELLLLGPAAALVLTLALALQWRRLRRLGRSFRDAAQDRLLPRGLQRFPTWRMLFLVTASFGLGVAAAGPEPPAPPVPEPVQPLDLAIAVDVSLSMGADDVGTERIERAREVVEQLSEGLPSARIVLVVFADWPYTLVPPTDDPAVVRYFAHSLSANLVLDRDQGTSFASALAHARAGLDARPRPNARRAILVVSDGGTHDRLPDVLDAGRAAAEGDVPIWTAGIGTVDGGTVRTASGTLNDTGGRPVVTSLQSDVLEAMASAGGGEYHDVTEDRGLEDLLAGLGALRDETQNGGDDAPDLGFWLTLAAIPLLLAEGALDAGRRRAMERRWGGFA